jgi:alpha-L-fucosidase
MRPGELLLVLAGLAGLGCRAPAAPQQLAPVPSAPQLRWHALEFYAFVHFNMNTFTDREWGEGTEDPALFRPEQLDCRQWARVAREAGMKGIILTAKHHDGFRLWPSSSAQHGVNRSPWRDGAGDVLRELSQACREQGLLFGLYLSPWDRNHPAYGDSERYNQVFREELEQCLTDYGPVFEVWFDGACGEGPNGKRQVYDWPSFVSLVRRCQPEAVIFSDAGPDVRWVGNERGFAGETNWCPLRRDEFYPGTPEYAQLTEGHEDGTHWVGAECDVSIRPGWYYHPAEDGAVKSPTELLAIWHASVGRGANLLLNLPVDRRGLVHERDVHSLRGLRAGLDAIYATDLARGARASASNVRAGSRRFAAGNVLDGDPLSFWACDDDVRSATLELELARPAELDRIRLEEHIALGQRVRAFALELREQGRWRCVARGTTVGARRILCFPAARAEAVRVRIEDSRAAPTLARFSLYLAPPEFR